jgi:hypothetical protein
MELVSSLFTYLEGDKANLGFISPVYRLEDATKYLFPFLLHMAWISLRGCIQKFPDWPPGARTGNGTALCH